MSALTGAEAVEARIAKLDDWRGPVLARMRELVLAADPAVEEAIKWVKPTNPDGVVAWDRSGMLITGEVYKGYVKLTFAHGAALVDPTGLFNAGFGGGTRRAIDLREGEAVDPEAFKALVRAAVARNLEARAAKKR